MKRIIRALCAVLCSAALLLSLPRNCRGDSPTDPVYSVKNNDKMMIALTFDDGPHPKYTPEILDILGKYGIPATFFTVGENIRAYPDIAQRCVREGHELANHTYTHKDLSKFSETDIRREITETENALWEATEMRPKLLRPPGGAFGRSVLSAAAELDYTVVLWNIDTRDWAHTPPKQIAKKVLSCVRSGDIVLMHDYIAQNSPTPAALRLMIPELLKKGYRFVTVSDLLGCK